MSLPPFLSTSEIGSYARTTILERKPQIISQVIKDNRYPGEILESLNAFEVEIAQEPVKPLYEDNPDTDVWNNELKKYEGNSWLNLPWYFAETFFYRKLLEAVKYFQPGPFYKTDPFLNQKIKQIRQDVLRMIGDLDELQKLSETSQLERLIFFSLWGNRTDLSNYTVKEEIRTGNNLHTEKENIIINDTQSILKFFKQNNCEIHFINDNVGADLFNDLILALFLINTNRAKKIVFHLKNQPFFVSDAMPEDLKATIGILGSINSPIAQIWFDKVCHFTNVGCFIYETDPFWTSCFMFKDMPDNLTSSLKDADLVILKGDVNYRRLLEDRHWPHHTNIETITAYFPTSYLILRTLKGEIMVGLRPGVAEELTNSDPTWLINGKRGVIQLILK